MTHEAIMEKLNEIFQDIFDDDTLVITENTTANDIEDWDSLQPRQCCGKGIRHEIQDAGSFRHEKCRRNGRHYCCPCRRTEAEKAGLVPAVSVFRCLKSKNWKQNKTKRLKCAETAGHFRRFAV